MNIESEHSVFNGWLSAEDMPLLPDKLAVGWSGGADSTALLLALKAHGYRVQAWHVDHGWRHSSAAEAVRLAEKAAGWKIPFISACLGGTSIKDMSGEVSSVRKTEAEARKGRYAQFQQWSRESGITTLCLAHHQDDQAETVCMRLLQGAGPAGCRGMWRERQLYGLHIVRPLLHLSGQQLRQALVLAGVDWFEDPSNADMSIWRNRIRHQLFPAMVKSGISPDKLFLRWQQQSCRVAERLDEETDGLLNSLSTTDQNGICLPWQIWKDISPPVRARLLQKLMVQLLGEGVTPGRRHITLIESWTEKNGRGGLDLSRCRLYRDSDRLHLQPATAGFVRRNRAVV